MSTVPSRLHAPDAPIGPKPSAPEKPRLMRRLIQSFIRPYLGKNLLAILCMAIVAACTTANAWMMQPVLDKVFVAKSSMYWLYVVAGAVLALAVIKGIASYFQQVLMTTIGQRVVADIQKRLFDRVIRADLAYFHATPSGELISRFTNDANLLRYGATQAMTGIGRDSLSVIGLIGLMFYQDWLLAFVAVVVMPAVWGPVRRISRRMRKVSVGFQEEMGRFTTLLSQVFQGARHVKAYGMEEHESRRVGGLTEKIFAIVEHSSRVRAASSPIMETLGGVAISLVILYGGWQVMQGERTPGAFFSFMSALLLAYAPIKNLTALNVNLQEGLAAAERIFTILDMEPAITERPRAVPLRITGGRIHFQNVRFAYGDGQAVLNGLDLIVEAGCKVALVGPSGGGKSTIHNLIPRFYDVTSGSVTIDGMDVRDVTNASLRDAVALVSQEVSLFDDTIRANIAYGRWDASEDEIVQAARDAAAHDFIMGLPKGYDTYVGEMGVRLSGGQRQRISIARAMLKDAPILLLDEATSALDMESERQVQDALRRLMTGRTTLVIAHRLSTIQDADLICAVEAGRIVESGTHGELLRRNGVYARLWQMQFNEADMPPATPAIQWVATPRRAAGPA